MRRFLTGLLLAASAMTAGAQPYPNRPINVIVPWPPGGIADTVGRIIQEPMRAQLGQPIILTHRAGATGTIGANLAARAAPDGYTLLLTIGAHPITGALMPTLPYDAVKDFAGISLLVRAPNMLVVRPDFPAKTLKDVVAMATRSPGTITYSTAGNGTTTHLMLAMFERAAGIKLNHIPYKGGSESLMAVLSSQTEMNSAVSTTAGPMIRDGRLRALAIAGDRRSTVFPDVPTFRELGFPNVRGDSWMAMFAPAGTPRPIIATINDVLRRIVTSPETRTQLQKAGEPEHLGPAELDALVAQELKEFRELGQAIGLQMN